MSKVLIVAALLGSLLVAGEAQAATSFVDVPSGHLFEDEIDWMATEGITQGCNPPVNDRYCPEDVVTRGQMAAFLVRALGLTDDGGGDLFVDDDSSVFARDIDRLGTAGITQGCDPPVNDRYCPEDVVTRGQMAAFLYRALADQDTNDPVVITTVLPDTTVGASYASSLAATGGAPPYTWSLDSGVLPTGINLSLAGDLAGNPLNSGVYSFTVAVTDDAGGTDDADLSITVVDAALDITTTSLPVGVDGEPYSYQLEAIGGSPPYEWAVIGALLLPPDLVLSSDGLISGTSRVGSGSGGIEFQVTDAAANQVSKLLTMTMTTGPVRIDTSTLLPDGTTGEEYEETVSVHGGVQPITLSVISGDLPPGIAMDSTGEFTGIPAVPGTYDVTIEAVDGAATNDTADISISVRPGPMTVDALVRVNVATDGSQADLAASNPDISTNGRYVVFETDAALDVLDTNGQSDIYRRDLGTGETLRVSVSTTGGNPNFAASGPSVSDKGRYVAFHSYASNLVAGDTNTEYDIFVRDLQAGSTIRVSVDSAGVESNGDSQYATISGNGKVVAFRSYADNLVVGDTNGFGDVFVHDIRSGATGRVSVDSAGGQLSSASSSQTLSGDGSTVVFSTAANNVVAGDTNGWADLYAVELATLAVERVTVDSSGNGADDSSGDASVSYNGNTVAFRTDATNLAPGDTNGTHDIFVRKRITGETLRASVGDSFAESNLGAYKPALSGGGRFVAFKMDGDELDAIDDNGFSDVYMYDIADGTIRRVSVRPDGIEGAAGVDAIAISFDGSRVVFEASAENLVDDDTNGLQDVFAARLIVPPTE